MTKPTQCSIRIPIPGAHIRGLTTQCEGRCFKAGKCSEHYNDSRHASEARGIEARTHRAQMIAAGKLNRHGRVTPQIMNAAPKRTQRIAA